MNALTEYSTTWAYAALDKGVIPDPIVRRAIRYLCNDRLRSISSTSVEQAAERKWDYIDGLRSSEVAIATETANEQHYEVSTPFIQSCLGKRMKYSCCLYPTGRESLDEAEERMLEIYCERAQLRDGLDILDLGCGWGSLSLYLAKKYPRSRITSLSNSNTQKIHIDSQAALAGITNLEVFTGDVKVYDFAGTRSFDRIISIEMFEHMKNYELLLNKIATWLKDPSSSDTPLLFVHIFCHKDTPYHFEDSDGWMAQHFFTGGTMPSFDLFAYMQTARLGLKRSWWINGNHYARTSEHWLERLSSNATRWTKQASDTALEGRAAPGKSEEGLKTYYRFRTFFLAVAEFFAMQGGEAWGVGHYVFEKR